MRLKRLEIAGFKSFPDRSELTFDSGVTAIVGPNGCGKSNVVDALTWVLGEQSAKSLRGDRMEDVIFGGSDARRPTAAAEVRLKLSGVASRVLASSTALTGALRARADHAEARGPRPNGSGNGNRHGIGSAADHGEAHLPFAPAAASDAALLDLDVPLVVRDVELMRRLYRSGESEYLIDGEVCRLRDVQDLLMDAGVGVKGYAVIEQGKIGQILSARPTDRRQLIEEAAGVTKYKSRRRAAELKLEAAQQNLTRVDDIVAEVERQRGALKRQAAKARRYRRLRDELRRWEKVQFAERYRVLGSAIESARARLAQAREREADAANRLGAVESSLESVRQDLAAAEAAATDAREQAHSRELTVGRLQQQIAFDQRQMATLTTSAEELRAEVGSLGARREPVRVEIEERRAAAARSLADRDAAASALDAEERAYMEAQARIEGLEGDVEAARSEVFAAVNAATALRHALEHAAAARSRIGEQIAKLGIEARDLSIEEERASQDRATAEAGLQRAREAMDALAAERASREAQLTSARRTREARLHEWRAAEQHVAGVAARLRSLEELDAARAEYGDGARLVLAESNGDVGHMGSVADYLEVDRHYERAVEACLGDLLQHVVVATHDGAAAGLRFASERNGGRVGFVVVAGASGAETAASVDLPKGLTALIDVVRTFGPAESAIAGLLAKVWLAESAETARSAAVIVNGPVVTTDGDVYRGGHVVEGGRRAEARGILSTKREIKELRDHIEVQETVVAGIRDEVASLDLAVADGESATASMQAELHRLEKAIVGFDLQLSSAVAAADRSGRKREQITVERRSAHEELAAQQARQEEARASITRITAEQQEADERLNGAQRRLFEAREAMQAQARRTAEAKAAHAALMERAAAFASEVQRLEEAGRELEARVAARREELRRTETRLDELGHAISAASADLETGFREFEDVKERVRAAEDRCGSLRGAYDDIETRIKDARRDVEAARSRSAQLDVERATAETDLAHLANDCVSTVQATLDDVAAEIEQLAREGQLTAPQPVDDAPDAAESEGEEILAGDAPALSAAETSGGDTRKPLSADEMVADLRAKIDRMGPVNMMAIDQFDDLESRHAFLTTQRKDLIDAIASTSEAIKKIDKTTKARFNQAFIVINENFERTFRTLFGGGRAGLVLLDESDALESGIDISAQPPGKRLQNVQLLSGGEKALTAMALMFAIFQYRPSPFCLLDEIDAPLDDANIGRFVDMLQGMQDHTQFILITHNRKTMEIADRLYGVTMEEPGVSKLISVQLN